MQIPDDWRIVINHSKNPYSNQSYNMSLTCHKKTNKLINLNKKYLSEYELSLLFYASDVVLLPYRVCSGSGVMFDAIGHGTPFISSNLDFFKEFTNMNLGIMIKRHPNEFVKALKYMDENHLSYSSSINTFKKQLDWNKIATQHMENYMDVLRIRSSNKEKPLLI
jgi:glycosyltransferase involved in cell wall biosynthesis